MRLLKAGVAAVMTVLTANPGAVEAQRCGPTDPGVWLPTRMFQTPPSQHADRGAMDANLIAAEALVRRTVYGHPRGFAVSPQRGYGVESGRYVRNYYFAAVVNKACATYDEHGSDFTVAFNPRPMEWSEGDRPMEDENGEGLYRERARTAPLFGSFRTFGVFEKENTEGLFLLFVVPGESPTKAVTREEYLRAQIFALEGKDQAKVKQLLAQLSKTQYQKWLDDAPARKKRNADMLAGVAIGNASQVEKVRGDLEKADQQAEETLKKQEPQEREELDRQRAAATAAGDKLRAHISAMTPAQRASPAFMVGFDFVEAGTPDAEAIVRLDPDFYRVRRSPAEVRAILVRIPNALAEAKSQHEQMYREFDWAALKALLAK